MHGAFDLRSGLARRVAFVALCISLWPPLAAAGDDPLPSWSDRQPKRTILDFVERVTTEGAPGYVPPAERIAVFDNDGTLWAEQPAYFQLLFVIDRVRAMAEEHPSWKDTQPYQAAIEGDPDALAAAGHEGMLQLVLATHAGLTADAFEQSVRDWLATARHPTLGVPYTQLVYQPQLELLDYLRANGFKTFIVSGGGADFLRVFAQEAYGIPPDQVVGSGLEAGFEMRNGVPTIVKQPDIGFINDKAGKPVGIHNAIGQRPLLAFGNSDGDLEMLQYTTIPRDAQDTTPRLGLIVHHDDENREFAYDRDSPTGRLDRALDEAPKRGWVVVSMKNDWDAVFPSKASTSQRKEQP